jgi:hypothetical protein
MIDLPPQVIADALARMLERKHSLSPFDARWLQVREIAEVWRRRLASACRTYRP